MEKHQGTIGMFLSWLLWLFQLAATHYSMVLSVACGLAALGASIYSIKANRAKARFYDRETDTLPQPK